MVFVVPPAVPSLGQRKHTMARRAADRHASDDRVLPVTRVVAAAIIPFLLLAFAVLYFWPSDTGRLFAWPIKPPLTAMVLASVYLGGAYFFLRAARASSWHTIKAGFPPVATFAGLLGIATLVHWDKFSHSMWPSGCGPPCTSPRPSSSPAS